MAVLPLRKSDRLTAPLAKAPPALWDPVVRLSHWAVAVVVLANALWTRGGGTWHVALGWAGMAILVLRAVWGLIGPAEARFSAFPPNPIAALRHLGQLARGRPAPYPSHNPAGAVMAYALWACLATVIATGLILTGGRTPMQIAADQAAVAAGDWSALVAPQDSGEDKGASRAARQLAGKVHEVTANLILVLAVLHVAGVALESRAMRRNLVAPMLLGPRRTGRTRRR